MKDKQQQFYLPAAVASDFDRWCVFLARDFELKEKVNGLGILLTALAVTGFTLLEPGLYTKLTQDIVYLAHTHYMKYSWCCLESDLNTQLTQDIVYLAQEHFVCLFVCLFVCCNTEYYWCCLAETAAINKFANSTTAPKTTKSFSSVMIYHSITAISQ